MEFCLSEKEGTLKILLSYCIGLNIVTYKNLITRMHSSRMRTGHSLTVCRSLLPAGGVPSPGRGGVVSQHALRQTPPPREQNDKLE